MVAWRSIWKTLKKVPAWTLLILAVISLLLWFRSCNRLVSEVKIATASRGGLYHELGGRLAPLLEERIGRPVTLVPTKGTVENVQLLLSGDVQFAILQSGAAEMEGIASVAPLYPDVLHVIVRRDSGITGILGLKGRNIAIGPVGSGMRASATTMLNHYRIDPDELGMSAGYFGELVASDDYDGAIVTSGMLNPDLLNLLGSGEYELLPVLDAEALALRYPYFTPIDIPRGMYCENPAIPPAPVHTVAATAFLGCREDTPSVLVIRMLETLYRDYPPSEVPTLIPPQRAEEWLTIPMHPSAHAFNNPFEGLGTVANFMESLAAFKELLFALGAGLYLLWMRIRAVRRRRHELMLKQQRERLDDLLNETVRIEREQMETKDREVLEQYLDDVTRIKLKALEELTHEDLRGDQMFQIFLMQCANLIRKIQGKLAAY